MKKAPLIVLAVFLISSGRLMAQGIQFGIKAGANVNNMNGRAFTNDFRFGFNAGAFAQINFTSHLGLQPELLFNQTRTQTTSQFSQMYQNGFNNQSVDLNYVTLPILLNIRPVKLLSILVGPQFGALVNTSRDIARDNKSFKSADFSVVGGAQLNLGGFKAGARYVVGLNNAAAIKEVSNQDTWRNQQIQVYVGFRII